jgi:hypothetical protein
MAFSIMKSFGMDPDPNGLDFELGHFGENYTSVVAQLVACNEISLIGALILRRSQIKKKRYRQSPSFS